MKTIILGLMTVAVAVLGVEIYNVYISSLEVLSEERARLAAKITVPFKETVLSPRRSKHIRILQGVADTRGLTRFRDSYYAATGGGLVEYSLKGRIKRHFTVLDGLPGSDLTAVEVFRERLYIGTRTGGLVEFDGKNFRGFEWTDREAQTVTALLNEQGRRLLIGTFNGGLLEFAGNEFREMKASGESLRRITRLERIGNTLYVGTFDDGLWSYLNDRWQHFGTGQRLNSNRVTGITKAGERVLIATDLGICEIRQGICSSVAVLPVVSGISLHKGKVFVSRDNGEIVLLGRDLTEFGKAADPQTGSRLFSVDGKLFLTGSSGIYEIAGGRLIRFGDLSSDTLTDNFVSALSVDSRGRLWSGTFRSGIDILSLEGKLIRHLESEDIREINFLKAGSDRKSMRIATTHGAYRVDSGYVVSEYPPASGFPSIAITHIGDGMIATAKGLALTGNRETRFLTSANRLPNNSVYTTLKIGKTLYAGTLSGLARITGNRVDRVWKDTNSGLSTNWVTALISVQGRLFIGTYGGGLFELLPSGEIHSFANETGRFVVNVNALASDGKRLFIGTLDGLRVLDLQSQEWRVERRSLPSETVMAIAASGGKVYIGTSCGIAVFDEDEFTKKKGGRFNVPSI